MFLPFLDTNDFLLNLFEILRSLVSLIFDELWAGEQQGARKSNQKCHLECLLLLLVVLFELIMMSDVLSVRLLLPFDLFLDVTLCKKS